jgi:hypothetical protein
LPEVARLIYILAAISKYGKELVNIAGAAEE